MVIIITGPDLDLVSIIQCLLREGLPIHHLLLLLQLLLLLLLQLLLLLPLVVSSLSLCYN